MRPRTGPRYEPRALLVNPRQFGQLLEPDFVQETATNKVEIAGAIAQHALVFKIRCALRARDMTVVDLAARSGLNYQRLARVIRGSAIMRMEDLGLISRVLPEAFDFILGNETSPFVPAGGARYRHLLETVRAALMEVEKTEVNKPTAASSQQDEFHSA